MAAAAAHQQQTLITQISDYMSGCSHEDGFICELTNRCTKTMDLPELLATISALLKCREDDAVAIGWNEAIMNCVMFRLPIEKLFLKPCENPDVAREPRLSMHKAAQEFLMGLDPLDAFFVLFCGRIDTLDSFDEENRTEPIRNIFHMVRLASGSHSMTFRYNFF